MGGSQLAAKPRRKAVIADVTTAATAPTMLDIRSHPVSLLWAHQLRREHAALHLRIEGLAKTVGNVRPDVDHAVNAARKASDGIAGLKIENGKDRKKMKVLEGRFGCVEDQFQGERENLKELTGRVEAVEGEVEMIKELESAREGRVVEIEKRFEESIRIQKDREDMVLVKDSMEGLGRLMKTNGWETTRMKGQLPLRYGSNEQDLSLLQVSQQPRVTPIQQTQQTPVFNREAANPLQLHASSSVEGEIDLDENFQSISYAGHNPYRLRNDLPPDSLVMIPELDISGQPKANEFDELEQGCLQSWDAYLAEGQRCFDNSPRRKEGVFVEAFVHGIRDKERRRDCESWLDQSNWAWTNVKTFDEHLARRETQDPGSVDPVVLDPRQFDESRNHEARAAIPPGTTHNFKEPRKRVSKETFGNEKEIELRASHRLIQRRPERQPSIGKKTKAKLQRQSQGEDVQLDSQREDGDERPSYQPRRQPQQKTKADSRIPSPVSHMAGSGIIGTGTIVTPLDQILPHAQDGAEPYTLPRMPAKMPVGREALPPPQGIVILPSKEAEVQYSLGRKRKRDYKGRLVRSDRSTNRATELFTEEAAGNVPEESIAEAENEASIEAGLLSLLERDIFRKGAISSNAGSNIEKDTRIREALMSVVDGRVLKRRFNRKNRNGERTDRKVTEQEDGTGFTGEPTQRKIKSAASVVFDKKAAPKPAPKIVQSQTAENKKSGRDSHVGRGGVRRMPPEIPILPSTPSDDESR